MFTTLLPKLEALPPAWTILGVFICLLSVQYFRTTNELPKSIPIFKSMSGFRSWASTSVRFVTHSQKVLEGGYKKFSDSAYQLPRLGGNIIVLPPSAVVELSSLPQEIADGTKALEWDLMGAYTGIDLITQTRLHHSVVARKLNPKIGVLTPLLEEELNIAADELIPKECDQGWTTVQPCGLFVGLVARIAARAFVGSTFCRNKEWLDVSRDYVEDLFGTVAVLRACPSWLRPLIARLLPTYWRCRGHFQRAAEILGPKIQERLDAKVRRGTISDPWAEPSVLEWLVEMVEDEEANVERISRTEIILSQAGINTMAQRVLGAIYDLMANPEYIDILRTEITHIASKGWTKSSYARLHKLDSFVRESQRYDPPAVLGMKRLMRQSYMLHDGTHLPKGSYVCVDAFHIENDPKHTVNPKRFDGLRSYRLNAAEPGCNKHSFVSAEPTVLAFGYGKTACPGRQFASVVIKMCMVKLLANYEFEFMPDQGRPKIRLVHEFNFMVSSTKIRMKKLADPMCPF